MQEKFKVITKYDRKFSVSNAGNVKNNRTGRLLKSTQNVAGYVVVTLNGKQHYVHRLILETFCPTDNSAMNCDHINNIKNDNRLENLQWLTKSENLNKAYQEGRFLKGSKQPSSKLTESDVVYIRSEYASGSVTLEQLAAYFYVAKETVWKVVHRKTWTHV